MPAIYDGEPGALGLALTNFSSREKSGDVAPCQEEIGDGGTLGKKYCTWGEGRGGRISAARKVLKFISPHKFNHNRVL
jgi:hypothetical protein